MWTGPKLWGPFEKSGFQRITICVLNVCWTDVPGREAEFEEKAGAFEHQANQIADTAIQLANAGGNTNKRLLDQIRQNAEEVNIPLISTYKFSLHTAVLSLSTS